jgi:hypothetical protein
MKQTMLSKEKATYLFDHVLDGFRSSHEGIIKLKEAGLIGDDEFAELLQKNSTRLISRVNAFKLGQQVVAVFFAALFFWIQISGEDMDMRRGRRGGRARRKNESKNVIII